MAISIVVMGVSGCGKSTLGALIAEELSIPFIEGDDFHPESNIQKMAAGQSLTDDDRVEFLENVGSELAKQSHGGAVASCSALKKAYRDTLRTYAHSLIFVMSDIPDDVLRARLSARKNHFMPASLLDSQLATLERPDKEEAAFFVDGLLSPEAQAANILQQLNEAGYI